MHALLLRAHEEALPLAETLKNRGIESTICPMFKLEKLDVPPLDQPQAIIITSKNALRVMENRDDLKSIPLYTVGDQTALFARKLGFKTVRSASGTSKDILALLLSHASREDGTLVHLSGEIVRGYIVETLTQKGFRAEHHPIYRMQPLENFPSPICASLRERQLTHVMFFSPHMARIFVRLIKKQDMGEATPFLSALCMSQDIANELHPLAWKEVLISPEPTVSTMLGYLNDEKES